MTKSKPEIERLKKRGSCKCHYSIVVKSLCREQDMWSSNHACTRLQLVLRKKEREERRD